MSSVHRTRKHYLQLILSTTRAIDLFAPYLLENEHNTFFHAPVVKHLPCSPDYGLTRDGGALLLSHPSDSSICYQLMRGVF